MLMLMILLFAGAAFILAFEGRMTLLLLGGSPGFQYVNILTVRSSRTFLPWALGFPLGAFLNVLIFFLYTLLNIPLTFWLVFPAHAVVVGVLVFLTRGRRTDVPLHRDSSTSSVSAAQRCLVVVLALSVAVKLFYGATHAVMLPTYYYDSLSQWTMRARVSYEDKAVAFDTDESRGISKPQYPILLHSLQMFFMLPQGRWVDAIANGATLLLTLSGFLALFLLLGQMRGTMFATIALWALIGIPLVSMHLAQGFGDIHVVEYLLLAATFLAAASRSSGCPSPSTLLRTGGAPLHHGENTCFLLSAIFVAAAAWVKMEGLVFGVVPWLVVAWFFLRGCAFRETRPGRVSTGMFMTVFLVLPWLLFLLAKGLPLSPHGSSFALEWHPEAILPALKALFASGSFGIHWYAVLGLGLGLGLGAAWRQWNEQYSAIPVIAWGLIAFVESVFVFLFTPNVVFLLNAQTFSRTMLIPLSLLVMGCLLALQRKSPLSH